MCVISDLATAYGAVGIPIEGNKLIPVGGNEVDDYFIKLVE